MDLTLEEKRIIFYILVQIMEADAIEAPAEIAFLNSIFQEFNLNITEFDHMDNLVAFQYLRREFSKFSQEKKDYSKKLFLQMANCDGHIDPREEALINKL